MALDEPPGKVWQAGGRRSGQAGEQDLPGIRALRTVRACRGDKDRGCPPVEYGICWQLRGAAGRLVTDEEGKGQVSRLGREREPVRGVEYVRAGRLPWCR